MPTSLLPPLPRRHLLALAVLLPLAGCAGYRLHNTGLSISQAELQSRLAQKFPKTLGKPELLALQLSAPQLTLQAASNRVSLTLALQLHTPLGQAQQGRLTLSSALQFDPERQAIVLQQPQLEALQLDGLGAGGSEQLQRLASRAVHELLQGSPIFSATPEQMARLGPRFASGARITVQADSIVLAPLPQ